MTSKPIAALLATTILICSGCISFRQEPKPDISALNNDLVMAERGDAKSQHQLATAYGPQAWTHRGLGSYTPASQRYLIAAAEQNDVAAQVELGRRYSMGVMDANTPSTIWIDQDYDSALYWLYRAARQRNASAFGELKALFERKNTPLFDMVQACKWAILQYPATNYCEQRKLSPEQVAQARRLAGEWLSQ